MPYTDTNVSNLIINKMTQAEYNALSTIDENQIYLITDDDVQTVYYPPAVLCETDGSTAAKTSTYAFYYTLRTGSHFEVTMRYANSNAGALTFNINSTGAKPIYINGAASSSTNYTLPAGKYIVYYDGTNYYFRTDGNLPGVPAVLSGTTAPSASDGLDGDIYIKYTV